MRFFALSFLALSAISSIASAITRSELVVQTRAADVIGDVLSSEATRAQAQVDTLSAQIKSTGGEKAFAQFKPKPSDEKYLDYRELFAGVTVESQKAETASPDGTMVNLTDYQLFQEMTTLQSHNLRQFVRVNQLRHQSDAMRQYLQSIGKWTGPATTQPAIATPADLLATMKTRADQPLSPDWAKRRKQVRNAVAAQVEAMRLRDPAASTARDPSLSPTPTASKDDPRFSPYYYGVDDGWSGWTNDFSDAFDFRGGGGVYRQQDVRVNRDTDPRMQGQIDRRLNIESDRRLNVHVDPRDNY